MVTATHKKEEKQGILKIVKVLLVNPLSFFILLTIIVFYTIIAIGFTNKGKEAGNISKQSSLAQVNNENLLQSNTIKSQENIADNIDHFHPDLESEQSVKTTPTQDEKIFSLLYMDTTKFTEKQKAEYINEFKKLFPNPNENEKAFLVEIQAMVDGKIELLKPIPPLSENIKNNHYKKEDGSN